MSGQGANWGVLQKGQFLVDFVEKKQNFSLFCSYIGKLGWRTPHSPRQKHLQMKQTYRSVNSVLRIAALLILFLIGSSQTAKACHGVLINTPSSSQNATQLTITGNSDPATCGCGPYWMEVEVACSPSSFTGNPPVPSSSSWGTYPWFHSTLNPPAAESCVLEPYFPITVPFAQLCPGTTYYWRVREKVENSSTGNGPWSAAFSFTTPGSPPVTTLQATASAYTGCPGDVVQLNATITGGCPGAFFSYSWAPSAGLSNANIANPVLTIQNSSTTYTCTVTGGCVTITSSDDTVAIVNGPPPIAGAPLANPQSVCSGNSSVIALVGQDPNSTIQWQISNNGVTWFNIAGATNDTLNTGPITTTLYYQAIVTGTGWPAGTGCGTSTSPPTTITVNPSPVADAGANTTICSGSCANLSGTGGASYSWQPVNQNTQNITDCPTSTTTYTLTVTDANGCTDTDVVTVNISNPTVTASPDVSICTGNTTVLIANGPLGSTYSWSPNGTLVGANTPNPTANPTVTTTYTVTLTNSFGCTAIDSVVVTVTAAPPLTVSNDTSMCAGGSAVLTASGATSYTWSPGNQTGSSITVTPGSTITYTVTGNNGNCISTDSITVSIAPPPSVYAGPDFSLCAGSQGTLNVSTTGSSYSWAPAGSILGSSTQQSVVIQPSTNTNYTVTVTDPNGCISTDVITVTINPTPTVTATASDNSICIGQSTTLSSSGATSYAWIPTVGVQNPNQVTTNATPQNTTTYQVVGTDANGCEDTASVTITVNPLPSVYLTSTPSECGDTTGTIQYSGVVSGTAPFTYTIGSQTYNNMPVTGLVAGTYSVTTTDANGCVSSQVVTVGQTNTSFVNASANPTFGVYPLGVGFSSSGSNGLNNWVWSFGDNSATGTGQTTSYTYNNPGTYTVVLMSWNDNPGCAVFDTLTIEVVDQAIIALPNVFTPNEDGTNDQFMASVSGVKKMSVEMYDRWGVLIYEGTIDGLASSPQDVVLWDGKSKGGNFASDGVYYYVVNAEGYDTKMYPFQGFVQLIRAKP